MSCEYCQNVPQGKSTICTNIVCRRKRNAYHQRSFKRRKKSEHVADIEQIPEHVPEREQVPEHVPEREQVPEHVPEMKSAGHIKAPPSYPERPRIEDCDLIFLAWPLYWSEEALIAYTHEKMVRVYEDTLQRHKNSLVEEEKILLKGKSPKELKQMISSLMNRRYKRKQRGDDSPQPVDEAKLRAMKRRLAEMKRMKNKRFVHRPGVPIDYRSLGPESE
jgi:hypothetical protein